ncbi:MAG: hypothetical protein P4L69_20925 [Desulfosporosinus sp.]|nr:hypothetical protein [Desulfosporosinus sp.]
MYFEDEKHAEEFNHLFQRLGKGQDKEYLAAFYVLTADEELRRKGAQLVGQGGIDWRSVFSQDWSSGYRLLLELAQSLFQSSGKIDLAYGLRTWDEERFNLAIQAIHVRRNGLA